MSAIVLAKKPRQLRTVQFEAKYFAELGREKEREREGGRGSEHTHKNLLVSCDIFLVRTKQSTLCQSQCTHTHAHIYRHTHTQAYIHAHTHPHTGTHRQLARQTRTKVVWAKIFDQLPLALISKYSGRLLLFCTIYKKSSSRGRAWRGAGGVADAFKCKCSHSDHVETAKWMLIAAA